MADAQPRTLNPVQFFSDRPYATMGEPLKKDYSIKAEEEATPDQDPDVAEPTQDVEDIDALALNASDAESGDEPDVPSSADSAPDDDDDIVLD